MAGKHRLVKLARLYEAVSKKLPAQVAAAAAPEINAQILQMGKPGGPLRGGNAAKAHVEAVGEEIQIVGVFSERGVRRSWVAAVRKTIAKVVKQCLSTKRQ